MIELAVDGVYRMEYDQITRWAAQAREIATSLGDQLLLASAVATMAWGAGLRGATSEAEGYRADAAELVDALSDHELALRLDAAVNLAGAELYLDRFTEARAHAERVVTVARATGQPAFVPFAFMLLAWPRMLHGELAEGGAMLDAAIEEARLLGNDQSLAGLLLNRSLTALAAGDLEIAVSAAEESVELTREVENGLVPAATGLALAAALLETGDPSWTVPSSFSSSAAAAPGSRSCQARASARSGSNCSTRCWLALGRPDDARKAAECAQATAAAIGAGRMASAMADRATAVVALASGDARLGGASRSCLRRCRRRRRPSSRGRTLANARGPGARTNRSNRTGGD